jgi:hypothetical protein
MEGSGTPVLYIGRTVLNGARFIMYSGITKTYYKKTVGHVFTNPVQTEGTIQQFFSPSKLFFIVVHISVARRCECM